MVKSVTGFMEILFALALMTLGHPRTLFIIFIIFHIAQIFLQNINCRLQRDRKKAAADSRIITKDSEIALIPL